MKKIVFSIICITLCVLFFGCQQTTKKSMGNYPISKSVTSEETSTNTETTSDNSDTNSEESNETETESDPLLKAEKEATPHGRKILKTGRQMTLNDREIVRGGCWDYANVVYNRAGYPSNKREIIFKGDKNNGPYADISVIESGDWLYYVNHSYGGIEHSAIFVYWVDYEEKIGLMLSYGGESRQEPARYLSYVLSNVYYIIRPDAE